MSTLASTADFLTEKVASAGTVRNRKMFGEYALYCDDKVVALMCDNRLFIKPTPAGKAFIGRIEEAPPYPGSKNFYVIDEDRWEDGQWLSELVRLTAADLPMPKKKRR